MRLGLRLWLGRHALGGRGGLRLGLGARNSLQLRGHWKSHTAKAIHDHTERRVLGVLGAVMTYLDHVAERERGRPRRGHRGRHGRVGRAGLLLPGHQVHNEPTFFQVGADRQSVLQALALIDQPLSAYRHPGYRLQFGLKLAHSDLGGHLQLVDRVAQVLDLHFYELRTFHYSI